jgi:excisionase family DNA binding protein
MSLDLARSDGQLLLSPLDAASLLGIGRTTLYKLLAEGTLPSVQIGRCRRIRRTDLDAFVISLPHGEER